MLGRVTHFSPNNFKLKYVLVIKKREFCWRVSYDMLLSRQQNYSATTQYEILRWSIKIIILDILPFCRTNNMIIFKLRRIFLTKLYIMEDNLLKIVKSQFLHILLFYLDKNFVKKHYNFNTLLKYVMMNFMYLLSRSKLKLKT